MALCFIWAGTIAAVRFRKAAVINENGDHACRIQLTAVAGDEFFFFHYACSLIMQKP